MTVDLPLADPEPDSGDDSHEEHDSLIGRTLAGTYVVERQLGEGGMGRVYLARHTRIANKRFAIKTLHAELARDKNTLSRFRREAEAVASISSPHVVSVVDIGATDDGHPFLVSELLEGVELGAHLDAVGRLPVGAAVRIVRHMCEGIAAAHDAGIVHRDIKPENVFLTGDLARPLAKVLDFGISRFENQSGKSLTRTGLIMGTPTYMAPEQAAGDKTDVRTDVYAAGAVLYTALTGSLPYDRPDASSTMVAVLTTDPVPPRQHEPSIPAHLELIIQKAMARLPEDRYPCIRDLSLALANYDEDAPAARAARDASPSSVQDEMLEARQAKPMVVLLCACGVLGLVAGLILAIGGVLRSFGVELGRSGYLIIMAIVVGTISTPLILGIRHLLRQVLPNTARAMALRGRIEAPLLVGAAVYALGALGVRSLETVVIGSGTGLAWAAWDPLLFTAAVASAAMAVAITSRGTSPIKRWIGEHAPLLWASVAMSCLLAIAVAAARRGAMSTARQDVSGAASASATTTTGSSAPAAASGAGMSNDAPQEARERSSEAELRDAAAAGASSLGALVKRFPRDPQARRALALALATDATTRIRALEEIEIYLALSPESAGDKDLIAIVVKIAQGTEKTDRALELLAKSMDDAGRDALYELMSTAPKLASRIEALFTKADVRAGASPAWLIAFDLRRAVGCRAKVALLDRVSAEGDERCVRLLEPLTVGAASGCGFLNLGVCPAQCAGDAAAMRKAIAAVRARLAAGASRASKKTGG